MFPEKLTNHDPYNGYWNGSEWVDSNTLKKDSHFNIVWLLNGERTAPCNLLHKVNATLKDEYRGEVFYEVDAEPICYLGVIPPCFIRAYSARLHL